MPSAAATQLPLPDPARAQFPASIDINQPLPGQIRAWIDQHASPLIRCLLNEADRLHTETRSAIAARRAAEQRVRDLEEHRAQLEEHVAELRRLALTPQAPAACGEVSRGMG